MSESYIQLQPDGSGKEVRAENITVGLNSVYMEVQCIADPTTAANVAAVSAAGALKVDASATTQPVSGTVTAEIVGNTGATIDAAPGAAIPTNAIMVGGSDGTDLRAILTDNTGQVKVLVENTPTVTANAGTNLNTSALALDTSVNGLLLAQASTTSGETGPLVQSATTTNAPTYTTAKTNPLSSDVSGNLRVSLKDTPSNTNNLNVALAASSATVTVSGTVTANAGTNLNTSSLALDTSVNGILVAQASTTSGEVGPLVQEATTTNAPTYTTGKTNPLSGDVSGNLRVSLKDSPSNTNNLNVNLAASAATVTVSGTVTANAGTNLNTSALALDTSVNGLLVAQGSTTSGETGPLVQSATTTNAPTYTTAKTNPLSSDVSGNIRVSLKDSPTNTNNLNVNLAASAATVTVSGTVAQGNTGSNAQAWWAQIGDTTNGPVKVKPGIGTATVPPTFSTAGATNADAAITTTRSPNSGLPAIIQKVNVAGTGSQSSLATSNFGASVTAGNSIVVLVGCGGNGTVVVTDSLGNAYSVATGASGPALAFQGQIFYSTNIKGGTNAITATPAGSTSIAIQAYEVSGIIGAGGGGSANANSSQNQQNTVDSTASQNGTGTAVSTAPAIPSLFPNEISFGFIAIGTANQTPTAFNPWNKDADLVIGGSPAGLFGFHSFSQPMGAPSGPVLTYLQATLGGSEPWSAAIACFKPAIQAVAGTVNILGSGGWPVDTLQGTVAPPSVLVVGGTYLSSPPSLANGQSSSLAINPSGQLLVNQAGNGTLIAAQQAVTGSAVALSSNACKLVAVKALVGNTINVYVGASGVTTATGFELAPGDILSLTVSNTNLIYVIASTTGASVSWVATN